MEYLGFYPLLGIGEIRKGDDVAGQLIDALKRGGHHPQNGDVLVVAHKIISKAEGRQIALRDVVPGTRAQELAAATGKPPALVQLILEESEEVVAAQRGILMCRSRLGWLCANAGVDQSNALDADHAILPPLDPDASAREISQRLEAYFGSKVAVIVSDTHGRPLREGIVGVAIGCWGMDPMRSYIGKADRANRMMSSSVEAIADELASAASLLCGQGAEGIPAVLVKGCGLPWKECGSQSLKRSPEREIFAPKKG
ncbi:MAG: coenzyme F420-0:L-glutamate ligase [Oscillospiraceae bacterium]|jgi:coenzyme F420-0:L-glutamate ligase/coenzyme F420-1:gamma-L-glutamate ligase